MHVTIKNTYALTQEYQQFGAPAAHCDNPARGNSSALLLGEVLQYSALYQALAVFLGHLPSLQHQPLQQTHGFQASEFYYPEQYRMHCDVLRKSGLQTGQGNLDLGNSGKVRYQTVSETGLAEIGYLNQHERHH